MTPSLSAAQQIGCVMLQQQHSAAGFPEVFREAVSNRNNVRTELRMLHVSSGCRAHQSKWKSQNKGGFGHGGWQNQMSCLPAPTIKNYFIKIINLTAAVPASMPLRVYKYKSWKQELIVYSHCHWPQQKATRAEVATSKTA